MRSQLITSLAAVAALGLAAPAFADPQTADSPSATTHSGAKMKANTGAKSGVNAVKSKCANPPLNTIPKDCVADTDLNAGISASTPSATTELNANTGTGGSTYSQPAYSQPSDSATTSQSSTSSSTPKMAKPAPAAKPNATSTPTQ